MALLIKPNGQKLEVKPSGDGPFTDLEICTTLGAFSDGYIEVDQQSVPEKYLLLLGLQSAIGQEYNPVASKMFRVTIKGNALLCSPEEYDPITEEENIQEFGRANRKDCVHPFAKLKFNDGFVSCTECGQEDLQKEGK